MKAIRRCGIDNCGRAAVCRGMCKRHYDRWRRTGSPTSPVKRVSTPMERVDKNGPEGCWLWTGYLDRKGYGRAHADGTTVPAHRWVYEHLVGPIPEGLTLDHLCRVKACVNPDHLEPVTDRENQRRRHGLMGVPDRLDACFFGHELVPGSYYLSRGVKQCKQCSHDRYMRRKAAKRRAQP